MTDVTFLLLFLSLTAPTKIQASTGPLAPADTNFLYCFQWQLQLLLKTMVWSNGKKRASLNVQNAAVPLNGL